VCSLHSKPAAPRVWPRSIGMDWRVPAGMESHEQASVEEHAGDQLRRCRDLGRQRMRPLPAGMEHAEQTSCAQRRGTHRRRCGEKPERITPAAGRNWGRWRVGGVGGVGLGI
jgi:hypothetical protein